MLGLGFSEIIFLAVLALVVIGPKQLPEVARTLGRFLNELRRSTSIFTDELKSQVKIDPFDLNSPPIPKPRPAPSTPSKDVSEDIASSKQPEQPELPLQAEFPLQNHRPPTEEEQKNKS